MTRTKKIFNFLLLLLMLNSLNFSQITPQIATTIDGRKVILKSDGTWEYQSINQNSPQNKQPKESFDTKPFDLNIETLPPDYIGHNAELIFNSLDGLNLSRKSGYTEKEWQSLIAPYKQEMIAEFSKRMGGLPLDSIFAFQAQNVFPKYDGLKVVGIKFDAHSIWFRGQLSNENSNKEKQVSSYVGQNSYGAKSTVKVIENESLEILLTNGNKFLLSPSEKAEEIGINFDKYSELASQSKDLKALIICKIIEPYSRYFETNISPTLSNPIETNIKAKALVAKIIEIWYYNPVTGKIYQKQKPK